ncbi:MAG: response regulator transcription factor [Rhodospirillales bacterium]|nr:response regulator transcription factor [Rhodospirillales bacterium]
MAQRILIVEDDEMLLGMLVTLFDHYGYKVDQAITGSEAMRKVDTVPPDMILLDLGLPDEDGLTLIRKFRSRHEIPIIVSTAREGVEDRLSALEMGVDDFIVKPYDPRELVLRVRNVFARVKTVSTGGGEKKIIEASGLELDLFAHSVSTPTGTAYDLPPSEFRLLSALINSPNRVLSRDQLLDAITTDNDPPSERIIDVLISRLRKKLEETPAKPTKIITVPGFGYKLAS